MIPTGRCAVIGAGIAGLACARRLHDAGAAVTIFEREAVPGGRVATGADDSGRYDLGAQYFTATDERFAAEVRRWLAEGIVQRWGGRIGAFERSALIDKSASAERYVGTPDMARLASWLAEGLDLRCGAPITALRRGAEGWQLDAGGTATAPFDKVLVALPTEPAVELLDGLTPFVDLARSVSWDPCWAVTLALAQGVRPGFEGAFIDDDPILGWAALDSAKPGRAAVAGIAERWVLHARPQWSRRYADIEPKDVSRWLIRSFSARLRCSLTPVVVHAQFWRQATPANPLPQRCLWDKVQRIGLAGDWCGGPKIEGAYLSGLALAEAVLG